MDTQNDFTEKVAIGIGASGILGLVPWLWGKIVSWWQRPTLADAVVRLSLSLDHIANEFVEVKLTLKDNGHASTIARETARTLLHQSPIPMFECALPTGECTWVNSALATLFEMEEHDMMGFGWLIAIPGEHRARVKEKFTNDVAKGIPYECDYPVRRKSEIVNVTARGRVVEAKDGTKLMVLGSVLPVMVMLPAAA